MQQVTMLWAIIRRRNKLSILLSNKSEKLSKDVIIFRHFYCIIQWEEALVQALRVF